MPTVRFPLFLRRPRFAAGAAMTVALASVACAQAHPVGADGLAHGAAVAAIVKVPRPWYAPRFVVLGKMRDTLADYRALPGLAFKAYSFAEADGHYGGVYLWKDLASARAWFTPSWFARIQRDRGVAAEVRFFEVVAAVDCTPGGTAADTDSPAVTTVSLGPLPAGVDKARWVRQAQATTAELLKVPGLLRRYVVVTAQGRVGHISLWRDRTRAREWFQRTSDNPDTAAGLEWFDTPILLPSAMTENQPRVPGL